MGFRSGFPTRLETFKLAAGIVRRQLLKKQGPGFSSSYLRPIPGRKEVAKSSALRQ